MIGLVYSKDGNLTSGQELGIKVATPVGTFVGQLFFGWLADVVGRKRMYGVELILSERSHRHVVFGGLGFLPPLPVIVATFGQTIAGHGPGVNIFGVLICWRFIMG